jgi:hypothetical protein
MGTGSGNTQLSASFNLTVNGSASASLTVTSGQPAAFTLTATSDNGFNGPIALTCSPLSSAPYASCSLLASTLTLGITSQTSTVTINTLTSSPQSSVRFAGIFLLSFLTLAGSQFTRTRRRLLPLGCLVLIVVGAIGLNGCGSGSSPTQTPPTNLRYTPPGTYQWNVTASSTIGPALSSSVVLTVSVQ